MQDQDQDKAAPEYSSGAGCLLRTYWLLAGPTILVFLLADILQKSPEIPSLQDLGLIVAAASLIAARYVDVRHYKGQTGYGEPATLGHWRSYALKIGVGSAGVWLAVRILAHYWR